MKKQLLVFLFCGLLLNGSLSCSIEFVDPPPPNNEVKATITFSTGSVLHFNAKGFKARMGNYSLRTFIKGTEGGVIYISWGDPYVNRIASPGTYPFYLRYLVSESSTDEYRHLSIEPGTITLRTSNDNYMEGYFSTVMCRSGSDSLTISGTFKGDALSVY